jgi:quercetin dioxygenase-like cupin family protein
MRRRFGLAVLVALLGATFYAGRLTATPGSGFSASTLAAARFGELDLKNLTPRDDHWQERLATQGLSDLYVQSNTWVPVGDATFPAGGSTGWHTHPGFSLIIVTAGAVTAYDGDDPNCTPQIYSQGMGFVDPGGGHVHLIRNEGTVTARTIAVQLIPAAATRRIDAPAPGNCPF